MRHCIFAQNQENKYKVAVLIKESAFQESKLREHYIKPLMDAGVSQFDCIGFTLKYDNQKKVKVATITDYLSKLLPALDSLSVEHLVVCDGEYFKKLTGVKKGVETYYGTAMPCVVQGYEHMSVVIAPNYSRLFYNPDLADKIDLSLDSVANLMQGTYSAPGTDIYRNVKYYYDNEDIRQALLGLMQYPALTVDIETFGLKFWTAGIGTITFCWDKHSGIAFPVDSIRKLTGSSRRNNKVVKMWLKQFFEAYEGKTIYHNANFDAKVMVYELFMNSALDQKGMLEGIEVMTKNFDDTKIISYLATNSCAGNDLSLKAQSQEFMGSYAVDVADITLVDLDTLLKYNVGDGLATWFVYDKNYPIMVNDNQKDVYETIMLPSVKVLLQIELTGMPMDMGKVAHAEKILKAAVDKHTDIILKHPIINDFLNYKANINHLAQATRWKKKREEFKFFRDELEFNPGSPKQIQELLYEYLEYPVIDKTDTKQPATGKTTIRKLMTILKEPQHGQILESLIELADASKILTTFIKAFYENCHQKEDGHFYLHGGFNIGGTVSGRLSSSSPNLQNLPSTGTQYAKLIKDCFRPPKGFIFCGADYASLEDRISALTTKDPEKLKVYQGHLIYEVNIDGTFHHIRDDDTIEYDGKTYTGEQFYETFNSTL